MTRPNFIIFLTDDQGYGDLSCMGGTDVPTPHLDALAASGVRFTQWYANAPVCSPSRAALLTGRYPGNAGVRAILAGHRTATGLPQSVPTLATALRQLGYRTAISGKWHLGLAAGCRPDEHGFEESFGFLAGASDYYSHLYYYGRQTLPLHDLWHNGQEVYRNGQYLTHLITEHAVAFLRNTAQVGGDQPFFLYVPFNAPHWPLHAPPEYLDRFRGLAPERRIVAAMISAMDDGVGAILDEVTRQGCSDNTCIFFMSDNGPSREAANWLDGSDQPFYGSSAGPYKGHKYSLYDGGIRVPALLRWPVGIPGGQVVERVGAAMDIFPTFLKMAGGDPARYQLDGQDILTMVAAGAPSPHGRLFWEMGEQTAVRDGRWKLVLKGQLVEGAPPEDDVHLADMDADPGERHNLREQFPDVVAELTDACETWRAGIEHRWQQEWLPAAAGTT